jgi:pimeloyl-ACP methyl ester carboxylesterase
MNIFGKLGLICGSFVALSACQMQAEQTSPSIIQSSQTFETNRQSYASFDGQSISYLERGNGPVLLLLHGFSSSAQQNFVDTGIVESFADAGYRVIAPDLRGHGASQVRDDARSWPRDAVARDQVALMTHLQAEPHAVIGYSFGSLTALRYHLLTRQGGHLVLGGIGDSAADESNTDRNDGFRAALGQLEAGEDTAGARAFKARIAASDGSLTGFLGALSSRLYTGADLLRTFDVPVLVMTGDQDLDNGSGPALATIIPNAEYRELTGTHVSAATDPKFVTETLAFIGPAAR